VVLMWEMAIVGWDKRIYTRAGEVMVGGDPCAARSESGNLTTPS